jgi:hypothetical protein
MGWAIREGKAISTRRDRSDVNGVNGQGFHPFFTKGGGNPMRLVRHNALWTAILLLAPMSSLAAEEGFTPLFDGKTLKGWTINCLPKDRELGAKAWTADQGTILANTMGQKDYFYILLTTNKEYGDFVLRLRIQVERNVPGNICGCTQ